MIRLTRDIAFAASLDAGNRAMTAGKRKTWSEEDAAAATREFQRLWPQCPHRIEREDYCWLCEEEADAKTSSLSAKIAK